MFITIKHVLSEKMIRLDDIESFSSKEDIRAGECKIYLQLKNREDNRDFISISEILVHDEDGELFYEKVEDLAHLAKLIEREKDYYARKELFSLKKRRLK